MNTRHQPRKCIVYVQYTNPQIYPPLENSARIFVAKGWRVVFLGIESEGDTKRFAFVDSGDVEVHLLPRWASRSLIKLHFLWFTLRSLLRLLAIRPSVIYLSDQYSTPLGALLTYFSSKPIVYHEHDHPGEWPSSLKGKILSWAHKRVAERCYMCILPNQQRGKAFRESFRRTAPVVPIMNCPSLAEIQDFSQRGAGSELRVYYHGSIVPNRLPIGLVSALLQLPSQIKLFAAGYETNGSFGYIARFQREAANLGASDRVHFLGSLPTREALLKQCAGFDVGLALLPAAPSDLNERCMAGASNKIFDYLACGLPVLVPDAPDYQELFIRRGVALACNPDDPSSIAAALRWLLDHPQERRAMGERGRQLIREEWHYERQFRPALDRLLARVAPAAVL
jgi:glycosyltransferase involved in cell wall biosynthesis